MTSFLTTISEREKDFLYIGVVIGFLFGILLTILAKKIIVIISVRYGRPPAPRSAPPARPPPARPPPARRSSPAQRPPAPVDRAAPCVLQIE